TLTWLSPLMHKMLHIFTESGLHVNCASAELRSIQLEQLQQRYINIIYIPTEGKMNYHGVSKYITNPIPSLNTKTPTCALSIIARKSNRQKSITIRSKDYCSHREHHKQSKLQALQSFPLVSHSTLYNSRAGQTHNPAQKPLPPPLDLF